MAGQLVGPAPTPHGALGGRQASAGLCPSQPVMPPRWHSRQKVVRRLGGLLAIRRPGDAVQLLGVEAVKRCQQFWHKSPGLNAVFVYSVRYSRCGQLCMSALGKCLLR